ncbi:MAG: hypothetical protein HY823_06860 [Acidobacteria bacterium]|nr:hypothetical protein [Acidobacteriota bacterium]
MRRAPFFLLATLLSAQQPPDGFPPAGLEVKPGSGQYQPFDRDDFASPGAAASDFQGGRTWRMILRAGDGRPIGVLKLLERLRGALVAQGWTWEGRELVVARLASRTPPLFLKAQAAGSGELRVVLLEKGDARKLVLPEPGPKPELPLGQEDFPYLPPWPGARISGSAVSRTPVDVKLPGGGERIVMVNWIDKEYALPEPLSTAEFLATYTAALERAGWVIEGSTRLPSAQIQASYIYKGRDLRATLRLSGDALGISVADVGAQLLPPRVP